MNIEFDPFSLKGKNILITGASSGIGRQCAIDCSKMGAKIIAIGRNKTRLDETLTYLEEENGNLGIIIDLIQSEKLTGLISEIVEKVGKIDGVIHCAGISGTILLKLTKLQEMERFMHVNVISAMELTREILKKKHFSQTGGSVVFMSSVMGVVGEKAKFLYSMTKGALISGCRSLALEYASRKIRVNCISPGVIETPINLNQIYLTDPEKRKLIEDRHPLGIGQTTDISNACIYLLSDASRWITGQNIIIDGGYTIQ